MNYSHPRILSLDAGVDPPTARQIIGRTYLQVTTDGVIDPASALGRDVRHAAIYDWLLVMRRPKEPDIRFVAGVRTHA
jgi:hypothetical protein